MEFPPDWEVMAADDFTTARPRNAGLCSMELLAQVRPNGRILDHYRVSLGGSRILDVNCRLAELLLCPATAELWFKYSVWPRDVDIKEEHVDIRLVRRLRPPGLQESIRSRRGEPAHPI